MGNVRASVVKTTKKSAANRRGHDEVQLSAGKLQSITLPGYSGFYDNGTLSVEFPDSSPFAMGCEGFSALIS